MMGFIIPVVTAGVSAFILSFAELFYYFRQRSSFIGCPLCTGFHLGYFFYIFYNGYVLTIPFAVECIFSGCVSGVLGLALLYIFEDG